MPIEGFPSSPEQSLFLQSLRKALKSLYDPSVLIASPLLDWLGIEKNADAAPVLRRTLIDAIERLKPGETEPQGVKTWRLYHVLHQRYAMQWPRYRVASNIGLGDRQLLREEKTAVELLAQTFWREYQLDQKASASPGSDRAAPEPAVAGASSYQAELASFGDMSSLIQPDLVFLNHLIQDVLKTLRPVLERSSVQIRNQLGDDQRMFIRGPVMRQALLLLFNQAVARVPHGHLTVQSTPAAGRVILTLRASLPVSGTHLPIQEWAGAGDVQRLLSLCEGEVRFLADESMQILDEGTEKVVFYAQVLLSTTAYIAALFVDDHADTLQLYQRYLEGTRYRFLSAGSARQGLSIAKNDQPQLIVVDVMMPQNDGWSMLEQLRVHPKTQHIPVLVCSIVPQQELAQALGAIEFLQKPISRETLLSTLDRHLASQQTAPR